jgi:hypothetical protein
MDTCARELGFSWTPEDQAHLVRPHRHAASG